MSTGFSPHFASISTPTFMVTRYAASSASASSGVHPDGVAAGARGQQQQHIPMNVLQLFRKPQRQQPFFAAPSTKLDGDITYPKGGWAPAGYDLDGNYIVLSRKTGQLVTLKSQDLVTKKLLLKLGPGITEGHQVIDPKSMANEFSPEALVAEIRNNCDEMGLFDKTRVCGPGLYRSGDDLVVNFGEHVATSAGHSVTTAPQATGAIYQSGPTLGFSMETARATEDEVRQVIEAVHSFGLRHDSDAKYLLGWLAMAFFGPAISHRPILAVTAERGAGKTTLIEFFGQLLGRQAIRRDGVPTVAQVIYELESRPAALLVDELEARRSNLVAVENFCETLRIGYSNSSAGRISRTIGGKPRYFNAPAGVMVAGIGLPAFNQATETRTVRICLNALEKKAQESYQPLFDSAKAQETVALGARVRRLLLECWPVMRDTLDLVRSVLISLGHEPRIAGKHAAFVAGYVALTRDTVPSTDELGDLVSELKLHQPEVQAVERDVDVLLQTVLNRKVVAYVPRDGQQALKTHLSIREMIQAVIHGPDGARRPLAMQLEEFGVRPLWSRDSEKWKLAICSSEHHVGMRKLMQRTDWALGGWKDVLLRMPGADSTVQKVAKQPQRVVLMDMPDELLETPEDEMYDFPLSAEVARA